MSGLLSTLKLKNLLKKPLKTSKLFAKT